MLQIMVDPFKQNKILVWMNYRLLTSLCSESFVCLVHWLSVAGETKPICFQWQPMQHILPSMHLSVFVFIHHLQTECWFFFLLLFYSVVCFLFNSVTFCFTFFLSFHFPSFPSSFSPLLWTDGGRGRQLPGNSLRACWLRRLLSSRRGLHGVNCCYLSLGYSWFSGGASSLFSIFSLNFCLGASWWGNKWSFGFLAQKMHLMLTRQILNSSRL